MSTPTEVSSDSNSNTSKGSERSKRNQNTKGRKGYGSSVKGSHSNNNNCGTTQKQKGATKDLGYHVFDCTSQKSIEACNETLKQIAIYVGKEYGKNADAIKYVIEHLEDPDLKPSRRYKCCRSKNRLTKVLLERKN